MSGESAPKPRFVLCPKCWQLLPEDPNFDVYKCGGCGTILQAKKKRNKAVNSESSSNETSAAPRNASDIISDDKQYSNDEKPVSRQENVSRENTSSSSSGDCYLEGNDGHDKIQNGECKGENLVITQENGLRKKDASSSSGECSLEGNSKTDQIENGECNGEKLVTSHESSLRENTNSSSARECSLNENDGTDQIKNGECSREQIVISQENGLREKATGSSSGECSSDGNAVRDPIENGELDEEKPVIHEENDLREKATSSSSFNGKGGRDQIEDRRHKVFNKDCSNDLPNCSSGASTELIADNSAEKESDTNLQLKGEELSNENVTSKGAGDKLIIALGTDDANGEKSTLVVLKSEVDTAGSELEEAEVLNNRNFLQEGAEQKLVSGSDGERVENDKLALAEAIIEETNKAESKQLNNGDLSLKRKQEEMNMCASDGEDPKEGQSSVIDAKSEVDISVNASTVKRLSVENSLSEKGSIPCVSSCDLKEGSYDNHVSSPQNMHQVFDHIRPVDTFDNRDVNDLSLEISVAQGELSKSPTTRSSHAYDGSVSSNDGLDEQNLYSFGNTYTVANRSEGGSRKGKDLVNTKLYGDLESQHQSYLPDRKYDVAKGSRWNQNEVLETMRYGHAHQMRAKKDEFPFKMPFPRSGSQSGYESGSPSYQAYEELYGGSSFVSPDTFEDPDQEKMKLLRMVYKLQDQLNRTTYANKETNERLSAERHISAHQNHDFHEGRFQHGLDYPNWDVSSSHAINGRQRHNNYSQIPYSAEQTSSTAHQADHPCFHYHPREWQRSGEFPQRVLYQHEDLYQPQPGHSCCLPQNSYSSSPPQWLMTSKLMHDRETKSCDQRHRIPEVNYIREKPSLKKRHFRPVAGGAPFVTCYKCLKLLQLPADFLLFKRVYHQLKCGACQEVLKFSLQNKNHIVSYSPTILDSINPHSNVVDPVSYSDDYGHSVSKSYSSEGDHVTVTPLHAMNGSANDNPSVSPVKTDESETEAQWLLPKGSLHQLMGYASPSQVIRGSPNEEH